MATKTRKTIKVSGGRGQKPITAKAGGLHSSTGTKKGQKIPESKHAAARSGKLGPKAQKQEMFYENVLHGKKPSS